MIAESTILLYHQVGVSPNNKTNLDCFCDVKCFEDQMNFLFHSEFNVIGLNELIKRINNNELNSNENYVVLTFDDGCQNFSKNILPILKKYNFPSIIYPVVGCLGKLATWTKEINFELKILTEDELKFISNEGVDIGAHTVNHVKLSDCDLKTAKIEIENSKEMLQKILGKEITSFSYPHGAYNSEISKIVEEIGFSNAVTCNSGFVDSDSFIYELPRKYVTYFDTVETLIKKLKR